MPEFAGAQSRPAIRQLVAGRPERRFPPEIGWDITLWESNRNGTAGVAYRFDIRQVTALGGNSARVYGSRLSVNCGGNESGWTGSRC
ncbi:hypothetical protein Mkiyose1665_16770 [Mycobacterium kiyosense]|uniref:Uncharacterized protein n=1 Tax=Mycobacterium kiyosense TaxID=2871094 RepID=A0A9P3Q458_9MYCO|nr:hypothetical protein IWGMT90018_13400 [Mycobacterium kiyosense]BDE12690.1 hypothetical protein MKCMC460_15500 [Mycobacterium sp. 20KCMC460]GLB82631.1 hypothetical protein SRL2020028_18870 [Mycobacterium kiyosense]GLB87863.1 hypothetical protein SRL2020130_06800 [Mycobacterium kiyosense]GLB94020.1 hypothetical protein SRL2020226_07960 [Mycobacterium kiyosense]